MQISVYAIPGVQKAQIQVKRRYTHDELMEYIKTTVIDYYGVDRKSVFSKRRDRDLVIARKVMHYLARALTKMSLKMIGKEFPGGRALDHTTVMVSIRRLMDWMDTDDLLKCQVIDIKKIIEGNGIEIIDEKVKGNIGRKAKLVDMPKREIRKLHQVPVVRHETLSESEKVMQKYL